MKNVEWFFVYEQRRTLSADGYLLSFLAPLPRQIAQGYRYQYDDGYAHANADPYHFFVESAGSVSCRQKKKKKTDFFFNCGQYNRRDTGGAGTIFVTVNHYEVTEKLLFERSH